MRYHSSEHVLEARQTMPAYQPHIPSVHNDIVCISSDPGHLPCWTTGHEGVPRVHEYDQSGSSCAKKQAASRASQERHIKTSAGLLSPRALPTSWQDGTKLSRTILECREHRKASVPLHHIRTQPITKRQCTGPQAGDNVPRQTHR